MSLSLRVVWSILGASGAVMLLGQLEAGARSGIVGADVIYRDCHQISHFGSVAGVHGYALGSRTCNIGDTDLQWGYTYDNTPVLGMNMHRLENGRFLQIGVSWAKSATGASALPGCDLPCNGNGGSVLGAGCQDTYSSNFNGFQSIQQARSTINPYDGTMPGVSGGTGDAIFRRLQVREADMTSTGALYFVEGVYVGTDDAQAGNAYNNASYRRVTVQPDFDLDLEDQTQAMEPAILAWRDHGLGVGVPDPLVEIDIVDAPGEGRFYVGSRAEANGDGTWRYDYAVFNLNSHRAGGSFSVPIPASAVVTGTGFNDVAYHSGEVYDTTDWSVVVDGASVTWSSPATFEDDPDSNALRWGTTYSFWFDANVAPGDGDVTLGLFRTGAPAAVTTTLAVPSACPGNIDGDDVIGFRDLLAVLSAWGPCPGCDEDVDGDDVVGFADLLIVLSAWGDC